MKSKDFDDFSFKAPSSEDSRAEVRQTAEHPSAIELGYQGKGGYEGKVKRPSDIQFRHTSKSGPLSIFDQHINYKINDIHSQLELNIKRRVQLEKKLVDIHKAEQSDKQRRMFQVYSNEQYKTPQQVAETFSHIHHKAHRLDQLVAPSADASLSPQKGHPHTPNLDKGQSQAANLEKLKEKLLHFEQQLPVTSKQRVLIPILQTMAGHKPKGVAVYTVPDQIKIQELLRRATFPELPKDNLEKLRKEVETLLAVHQPHSDIHYLCMVVYFHAKQYLKVRQHFEVISNFKSFNPRAYWVAAETEFALDSYELCLALSEECINRLEDRVLARMMHLKGRCYEQLGNYVNSIICYNQLIKIKPKIAEYYLERGILYHRVGYYKEAKEDFVMFGLLRPDAEQLIKDKILAEPNQIRRKEYIALLVKMY